MDAVKPTKESGPDSLNISSKNPVAADVEKRRTKIKGINWEGKENNFFAGRKRCSRKVKKPDARRADTALIKPIKEGAIFNTVRNPRSVPEVNKSKTGSLFNIPESIIVKMTKGIAKLEKKRR